MSILSAPLSITKTLDGALNKYDHQILLVDHTKPQDEAVPDRSAQATDDEGEQDNTPQADTQLTKRWTAGSLKERATGQLKNELTRRKFAKYQEGRESEPSVKPESSKSGFVTVPEQQPLSTESAQADAEQQGFRIDKHLYRRGRDQIHQSKKQISQLVKGKRASRRGPDADAVIDILYENQRGTFLFGIPLFSSNSLLQIDPSPWQTCDPAGHHEPSSAAMGQSSTKSDATRNSNPNGKSKKSQQKRPHQHLLRPSPVNITNAQVPDPCWEWAWPSWYVDMSHDVDEEGWEYSFSFGTPPYRSYGWHGTQKPWWHAFVRRRRWIRMRRRKHAHRPDGGLVGSETGSKGGRDGHRAHMLNADYFTVHPARDNAEAGSIAQNSATGQMFPQHEEDEEEDEEIADIGALMKRLKKATIDREKIVAVKRFLKDGGDDIYYLAEYMPNIMTLLVFQTSRRHLLSLLMHAISSASHHRTTQHISPTSPSSLQSPTSSKSPASSSSPSSSLQIPALGPESDAEKHYIDSLLRATHVAEHEIRKLEYWSDIKDVVRNGESLESPMGWGHEWQGIDQSGPEAGMEAFGSKEEGNAKLGGQKADPQEEGREMWEEAEDDFHPEQKGEEGKERKGSEGGRKEDKGKGKA